MRHMRDAAREALQFVKGKSRQDLDSDRMLNLSLVRLTEIIGEAAARVPNEVREKYPEIQWPQITGIRNRLIHGYDDVDFDVLWQAVTEDFQPLVDELERILQ